MRVELRARYAGPNGNSGPGSVLDLDDKEAQRLIDGGYAVEVKPAPKAKDPEKRDAPERETASVEQNETASAPPPRRRRKTTDTKED